MSAQQNTLAQLNKARDLLDDYLLANTAPKGTPQWNALQPIVQHRTELTIQINKLLAAQFPLPSQAMTDAVTEVTSGTNALAAVAQTLANVDKIVSAVDDVVQAATDILTLVGV